MVGVVEVGIVNRPDSVLCRKGAAVAAVVGVVAIGGAGGLLGTLRALRCPRHLFGGQHGRFSGGWGWCYAGGKRMRCCCCSMWWCNHGFHTHRLIPSCAIGQAKASSPAQTEGEARAGVGVAGCTVRVCVIVCVRACVCMCVYVCVCM